MLRPSNHSFSFSSWVFYFVFAGLFFFDFFCTNATLSGPPSNSHDKMPNLPFGDINVVVLTDVHSWVGGHRRQEPYYDADLGDVLSLWENLKKHCDEYDRDIFFVNNGDFVHGTGLSQMGVGDEPGNYPGFLIPILEKMPYDAVNCGNHELYSKKNIEYMTRPGGYVDWYGDRYLTSNINKRTRTSTKQLSHGRDSNYDDSNNSPLANRYKILHGRNSKLLVFGFLYNMRDSVAPDAGIVVEDVEKVVKKDWFLQALSEKNYDAILVLAHMDLVDPLVEVIRSAIRTHIGEGTPVVFITGHTHYRGVKQLDDLTMTFEAGRFMDTVGFVSFPKKESVRNNNSSALFSHKFLDANQKVLFQDTLGFSRLGDGSTKNGKDLSTFIDQTRQKLGLKEEIGCAPQSYFVERHVDAKDSLWGLYRDEVIPKIFFSSRQTMITIEEEATNEEDDLPMAMLLSKDSWRYDLFNNATLIVDDIDAVAPFNDTVVHLGTFTAKVILKANRTLNEYQDGDDLTWLPTLPNFILIGSLDKYDANNTKYHLYSHEVDAENVQKILRRLAPEEHGTIKKTEFRSTMIWMAFVDEYWTCDGEVGQLPEWFPTPQSVVQNLNSDEKDYTKLLIAIFIIMVILGLVATVIAMFWIFFQKYLLYQPVMGGGKDDIIEFQDEGIYKVDTAEEIDHARMTSMGEEDPENF
mmetsp:Transcript_8693/g.10163  ORF Transcript_8693/g.10163 Transcript_8693/m.10163 type:complete len:691 (+) Transcript_8693:147-2219(+)